MTSGRGVRMHAMATIVVMGALDTKGAEVDFLRRTIAAAGHRPVVVDTGVLGAPSCPADVTREDVAAAGGYSLPDLVSRADRGEAVTAVSEGAVRVALDLRAAGRLDGIIAMGGGAGTTVGTAAMRALPLGIPKVMVSTLASGDVRGFLGVKDIVMVPAIVDISGLNRISRGVFTRAAGAICGMVESGTGVEAGGDAPIIAASMFGNTTPCVEHARALFERKGFEVLVFHATGTGGQAMESLVEAGDVAGVLDVTTTEWADELVGGVMSAGPHRLEAAARRGTPAVIAPGCLDMVNFWEPDSIPEHLRSRRLYRHNAKQTLVRTTPDENTRLGEIISGKLNASIGPVAVYLPLRGISVISAPDKPYYWPEADRALFDSLKTHLRPGIPCHELDCHINDPAFASAMAEDLLSMCAKAPRS